MNIYFIFLAILSTILLSYFNSVEAIVGAEGVSLHELTSIEKFKCLKENLSVEFVIVQASRYNGLIDPNAINNILNALAQELKMLIFIFILVLSQKLMTDILHAKNNYTVLNDLQKNNTKFGRVWLKITENCINTHWPENKADNVEFIEKMINTLIEEEQKYGIYTSKYDWNETTNSTNRFSRVPLWYIYNDGKNNFNDFYEKTTKNNNYGKYHSGIVNTVVENLNKFGEWETPTIKQYSDEYSEKRKICGKGFDYLYW